MYIIFLHVYDNLHIFCFREVSCEYAACGGSIPGEAGGGTDGVLPAQPPVDPLAPRRPPLRSTH